MKNVLKRVLNSRVHSCWFILSCLLLGAVLMTATLMTWELSSCTDKVLNQSQTPMPHRMKV